MLESNPPRNSQLETHPNESWGVGRVVSASLIIRIDFPIPFKTHQVKVAAQRHPICFRVCFAAGPAKSVQEFEKGLFKWPWLHFLEVSHSSSRGFSASFRN
jgi:hypothetical protein